RDPRMGLKHRLKVLERGMHQGHLRELAEARAAALLSQRLLKVLPLVERWRAEHIELAVELDVRHAPVLATELRQFGLVRTVHTCSFSQRVGAGSPRCGTLPLIVWYMNENVTSPPSAASPCSCAIGLSSTRQPWPAIFTLGCPRATRIQLKPQITLRQPLPRSVRNASRSPSSLNVIVPSPSSMLPSVRFSGQGRVPMMAASVVG